MAKQTTDRLKCNPPLGTMPVLQFCTPAQLQIDAGYQRSIESGESQALIRRIAQHWDWGLCLPLVVARRPDGALYVIDGQHRLAGARLRGDIAQLPCVVIDYADPADEAASFVELNQRRRPLNAIDLFKAALASGDGEARAIMAAIEVAGLALAPHSNPLFWQPGMIGCIGGIRQGWKQHGKLATREALEALSAAFAGEVQHYAGTILPGVLEVCAQETRGGKDFEAGRFAAFTAKLGARGQNRLREDVLLEIAAEPGLGRVAGSVRVITELWWPERRRDREAIARAVRRTGPAARPQPPAGVTFGHGAADEASEPAKAWCEQCDKRVSESVAAACRSEFCSLRKASAGTVTA